MQERVSRVEPSRYENISDLKLRKLFEFHRSRGNSSSKRKRKGNKRNKKKSRKDQNFQEGLFIHTPEGLSSRTKASSHELDRSEFIDRPRQYSTMPMQQDYGFHERQNKPMPLQQSYGFHERQNRRARPCPTPFPPREKRKAYPQQHTQPNHEPIIWHRGNMIKFIDRQTNCGLDIQKAAPYYCVDRRTLNRWFNRLEKEIDWTQGSNHGRHGEKMQPRLSCWVSKCDCKYFYGSSIARRKVYPDILEEIERVVFEGLGFPTAPDCCFLNFYRSEEDCIGWHQDDEELFDGRNSSICVLSLSLGATRDFQIRLNTAKKAIGETEKAKIHSFPLANGDLCCMNGFFQKFYKHRVPPAKTDSPEYLGPRISLTWRWIINHNCCLQHQHHI